MTGTPIQIIQWLYEQDKDKKFVIDEYKEKRGLRANKYFHTLVNQLAKYNRGKSFAISDEEMKIKMNLSYGTIATDETGKVIGCKLPKGTDITSFYPYAKKYKEDKDGCDCYIFYKRTSELNSKEFWQLIKGVEVECEKVGIPTLDDIELERMMKEYDESFK